MQIVLEGSDRWPGQRQPTPAEVSVLRELMAAGYPRSARDGGQLRKVS